MRPFGFVDDGPEFRKLNDAVPINVTRLIRLFQVRSSLGNTRRTEVSFSMFEIELNAFGTSSSVMHENFHRLNRLVSRTRSRWLLKKSLHGGDFRAGIPFSADRSLNLT